VHASLKPNLLSGTGRDPSHESRALTRHPMGEGVAINTRAGGYRLEL